MVSKIHGQKLTLSVKLTTKMVSKITHAQSVK